MDHKSLTLSAGRDSPSRACLHFFSIALLSAAICSLAGCSAAPLDENTVEPHPMLAVQTFNQGVSDGRARFREIFCAITELRGAELPDYIPCEQALVRLEGEGPPSGAAVELGKSRHPFKIVLVQGVGWECFNEFIDIRKTVHAHLSTFGHEVEILEVDSLSSSAHNATMIRDRVIEMQDTDHRKNLVLVGYSKGAPDVLEAVVRYPELHDKIAAVVSVAGAVGGSPLADDEDRSMLKLFRLFPGAECELGDLGALESLEPIFRRRWMANHILPDAIRYYSVITFPEENNISSLLKPTYRKLSQINDHNDGQLIFYDQAIPGSVILGFVNADHWAVGVPINRSHAFIGATLVDKNAFPREILLEAVVRYLEEDL